jgi:hypothetical protein
MELKERLESVQKTLPTDVTLVAVSKTQPLSILREAYDLGLRIFGENKVQELCDKQQALPQDIEWHMIGHLQRNKVKYIAPFVHLIHSIDSPRLLAEVNKQGGRIERVIDCLLQVHIAEEETKYGLDEEELFQLIGKYREGSYPWVRIRGLMGMATFTDEEKQVAGEFGRLKALFDQHALSLENFDVLSMGMSGDYKLALKHGSTMLRLGSSVFGPRNQTPK